MRRPDDPTITEEFRAFVRASFWRAIREAQKDAEPDPDEDPTVASIERWLRENDGRRAPRAD